MKKLDITKSVDDFLEKLPPKQFKQVFTKITSLRINSSPHDSEKLKGFQNQYRVDSGEYRIIYKFDNHVVYIMTVGKRNDGDVYKKHGR